MFTIADHKLFYSSAADQVPPITWLPTENYTHNRTIDPDILVIHYTAGASARSTADWCLEAKAAVSYHAIIDRDGSLIQQVPFNRRAWHAGQSRYAGQNDVNSFSLGIALANFGWLSPHDAEKNTLITGTVNAEHKYKPGTLYTWETYPSAQLLTLTALIAVLLEAYPIAAIVGHDDIAPARKMDPGPAFYRLPAFPDRDLNHPLFSLLEKPTPAPQPPTPPQASPEPPITAQYRCTACSAPCDLLVSGRESLPHHAPTRCPYQDNPMPAPWSKQ